MASRPSILGTGVLLLGGLLAGCSGADREPEAASTSAAGASSIGEVVPLAGTCWSGAKISADAALELVGELDTLETDALAALPALSEPIDCANPHGIEVLSVVVLEGALAKTTYRELVDPTGSGYAALRSAIAAACRVGDPALVAAADASPLDLIPSPAFAGGRRVTWTPMPYAAWQEGREEVLCTFEQDEPGTVTAEEIRSAELDPAARLCMDADLLTVACDEPHTREQLLTLTATPAVAAGQLPGRKAVTGGDEKYVELRNEAFTLFDAECDAYFRAVAAPKVAEGLVAVAEFYPELWGDEAGEFSAVCTVSSPLAVASGKMLETSTSVVG